MKLSQIALIPALAAAMFLTACDGNSLTGTNDVNVVVTNDVVLSASFDGSFEVQVGGWSGTTVLACVRPTIDPDLLVEVTAFVASIPAHNEPQAQKTGGSCANGWVAWKMYVPLVGNTLGTGMIKIYPRRDPAQKLSVPFTVVPATENGGKG